MTQPESGTGVPAYDAKAALHETIALLRATLLWKVEGLTEAQARRPMTPTGTNLLGLIKHESGAEGGYFGLVFGRPFPEPLAIFDRENVNLDFYATAEESPEQIIALARRVWAHADATIEALSLDAVGDVFWWPPDRRRVTLHQVMVHMLHDLGRHAGHADILRELIDGRAGLRRERSNLPETDEAWWADYRARLTALADAAEQGPDAGRVIRVD